ncbi:HET-domain-containing protein, partial [Acephala macrosclerotiorum]
MINQDDGHQDAWVSFYSSSFASRLPYVYSALNEEAQEIRLLTILPNAFASEVQVTLQTHVFAKNAPLQYEALSYAWGSPKDPADIIVGSPYSHGTISVTQNLAEALRYLRYEDKIRTLWIDAICVNQLDMAERTSQVKRMADIYSAASRVVVWLGPESDDSTMAM